LHLTRLVLSMAQIGRIMQQFELELGAILVDAGDAGTSAPPVHVRHRSVYLFCLVTFLGPHLVTSCTQAAR